MRSPVSPWMNLAGALLLGLGGCTEAHVSGAPDGGGADGKTDGPGDAGTEACDAPFDPPQPVTQPQFECMARGWARNTGVPGAESIPSLPFYQPSVAVGEVDEVVQNVSPLPANNRYVVLHGWNGNLPIIPITSWRMSEYTGLDFGDPVSDYQRGQVDSYGQSAAQLFGKRAGLWLNSHDPGAVVYSGSASMNTGCWYQSAPFAPLFPTAAHELDVAFDAGVHFDGSRGNGHTQAYFQMIVTDQSGNCGTHCNFSFSMGYYSKYPENADDWGVSGDDTGTLSFPLAGAALNSPQWITRMPDSMGYQTGTFAPQRVHFRMSSAQFLAVRNGVAGHAPSYAVLSSNPADYGITLLNVNGEVYDPCKDPLHIRPCLGGDYARIGMTVGDFRVTSVVPHEAAGVPAFTRGATTTVLFRTAAGPVAGFADTLPSAAFQAIGFQPAAQAAGDLAAFTLPDDAANVSHVVFRTAGGALGHAKVEGSAWSTVDDLAALGLPAAASDPTVYADETGSPHVLFRDEPGHIHDVFRSGNAWTHRDLSALATPVATAAAGTPMGYGTKSKSYVVYRDAGHHVRRLELDMDGAREFDLSTLTSAPDAYAEPQGIVTTVGVHHVVYRDINGAVHDLSREGGTWNHDEVVPAGVIPSLGSPRVLLTGCTLRIVYTGVDHHVHLLSREGGEWTHEDLFDIRGALPSADDPVGFVDSAGIFRIEYRGTDNQLHEFYGGPNWLHRDM